VLCGADIVLTYLWQLQYNASNKTNSEDEEDDE
jgi:hypothetical protein